MRGAEAAEGAHPKAPVLCNQVMCLVLQDPSKKEIGSPNMMGTRD